MPDSDRNCSTPEGKNTSAWRQEDKVESVPYKAFIWKGEFPVLIISSDR